jgi:hypothetical protein
MFTNKFNVKSVKSEAVATQPHETNSSVVRTATPNDVSLIFSLSKKRSVLSALLNRLKCSW